MNAAPSSLLQDIMYYHSFVVLGFGGYLVVGPTVEFPIISSYVKEPREVLVTRNWGAVLMALGYVLQCAPTYYDAAAQKELGTVLTGVWALMAVSNLYSLTQTLVATKDNDKYARDRFWVQGDLALFVTLTVAYAAGVYYAE
uniref:Uncharacterized protein n=1 Tax=Entomoneis paludosa TaxID=265537 RepID=A0A7S3DQL5_9STRA|mmetsp:Transcript_27702/g.57993  ORF Transcript_27702/g.57993 Transcript_27702/m.57993 type:complete len:142 (+) Transcript_27702:40-465(+)|eukprot:CAMPEP_0172449954 /NCGR_PEP_ID=MMETSP1065-20121228/8515_1 /TAXON_ID=265537 /ORGANISM="Amphiprora paludosa, Strain CCMP125" /LENGTH=141 /DNA_ID=CAMNT_0013201717 /DNA_START=54 /DNA_END=479 /DNA_ORIENTATION=+